MERQVACCEMQLQRDELNQTALDTNERERERDNELNAFSAQERMLRLTQSAGRATMSANRSSSGSKSAVHKPPCEITA
jgi:hypothetical protein